mmetsp:Transcript_72913/g.235759  ORF Transcript_72913/g.235759 Transcript_72913/m.235759 type:complete len:250 (+) Transcript_72913:560-1309(+)
MAEGHTPALPGVVDGPVHLCFSFGYSVPWRRAIHQLFQASDLDSNGFLSVPEMCRLANITGEDVVNDVGLEVMVKQMGFDSRGLPVRGLVRTYELGGNDTVLTSDLETFGLLGFTEVATGSTYRHLTVLGGACAVVAAAAVARRRVAPRVEANWARDYEPLGVADKYRLIQKYWIMVCAACVLTQPWSCRWWIPLFAMLAMGLALFDRCLDVILEEGEGHDSVQHDHYCSCGLLRVYRTCTQPLFRSRH